MWAKLSSQVRKDLTRWAPKAPLEFAALMDEPTTLQDFEALDFPILVLRGELAPTPTRLIADALPDVMDCARLEVIAGAEPHGSPDACACSECAHRDAHRQRGSDAGSAEVDDASRLIGVESGHEPHPSSRPEGILREARGSVRAGI